MIRNPVISAYLQSRLLTGARREELAGLRWEDVDFRWRSICIKDKVERMRTIGERQLSWPVGQDNCRSPAFNALDAGYVPDLPRLLTELATVLTYDVDLANMMRNNMSGTGPYFVELDPDALVEAE